MIPFMNASVEADRRPGENKGGRLLYQWRTTQKLSMVAAGRLLNLSVATICDYEKGKKLPGVVNALAVASTTKGAVPVESWGEPWVEPADIEEDEHEPAAVND